MRVVIQRVLRASVRIGGKTHAAIDRGLLLLAGMEKGDKEPTILEAADKIVNLRVFPLERGKDDRMNRSVLDVGGEVLVVSQFTLAGSLRRGRRPSFDAAAPPAEAEELYERFVQEIGRRGIVVRTGLFRAMMEVELVNDGPVTFVWESAS